MKNLSIAIVGGDLRFVRLSRILINHGYEVWTYGIHHTDLPKEVNQVTSLKDIRNCNYVIGPIPFTRDGKHLFSPLSHFNIVIDDFLEEVKNSYLCLAVLSDEMCKKLKQYDCNYTDMLEMDEVAILNAIPTAEGAIQYAMQHSEITLHNSKCLILGFGRCGKILAPKLKGIGAKVYVEARKTGDLAYISAYDYVPIALHELHDYLDQFDFIFNTVPVQILDEAAIDLIPPHTIYIELASSPGGIDIPYCQKAGIRYIPAPSLPGKVAPMTAASILYHGLQLILEQQEVKK